MKIILERPQATRLVEALEVLKAHLDKTGHTQATSEAVADAAGAILEGVNEDE